jgi:hypothetical protein
LRELALHLLDIAENSVAASAKNISISVEEDTKNDRLRMSVQDDGVGMDANTVAKVIDPFYTTRTTRKVGLGIPLLKEAAEACNGFLTIQSEPGRGTRIDVEFQHSHIDRMPLGNLAGTFLSLLIAYPHIHWTFRYWANEQDFEFDDAPIKKELEGISLTEPDVLSFIRQMIETGIADIQPVTG